MMLHCKKIGKLIVVMTVIVSVNKHGGGQRTIENRSFC